MIFIISINFNFIIYYYLLKFNDIINSRTATSFKSTQSGRYQPYTKYLKIKTLTLHESKSFKFRQKHNSL
jgi:hypothetical protein